MKTISLFCAVFLLLISQIHAQGDKFTCTYDDWADRHNDNAKFNELIDKACSEINAGHYKPALDILTEAVAMSAVDNGGEPNVFIDAQHRKLKDFIENSNTSGNATPEPAEATPVPAASTNEKAEEIAVAAVAAAAAIEVTEAEVTPEPVAAKIEEEPVPPPAAEPEPQPAAAPEPEPEPLPVAAEEPPVSVEPAAVVPVAAAEVAILSNLEPEPEPEPVAEPVQTSAEPVAAPAASGEEELEFTEEQKEEFRMKGEQKIKQFESYFFQIGSKSTPASISSQAIENAVLLFDREDRTIQVSSINKPDKPKYKVKLYLQRVKNLNYDNIDVEWADFQYASEFRKGPDGNYYGYVVFSQRFTGTKDNQIVYEDITKKRQEIVLKFYEKAVQGEMTGNWDVFLGDMSVLQTSGN